MTLPGEGIHNVAFAHIESTFNTRIAFVGGDAIEIVSLQIQRSQNKVLRKGHTGDASPRGRINGKQGGTWNLEHELKVNAAGTVPETSPLLTAAFGSGSENDGVSTVVYTLQNGNISLQLAWYDTDGEKYEQINGAIVSAIEFTVEGDAIAMIRYEGEFASYSSLLGNPQAVAALAAATTETLADAQADRIIVGAGFPIVFGAETNSGAGYLITSLTSAGLLTWTPALAGPVSNGDDIAALLPTASFEAGTYVSSLGSALTLDSASTGFISAKIRLETGRFLLNREANSTVPTRIARKRRAVSGSVSMYLLDENAMMAGNSFWEEAFALSLRIGENTAGARAVLSLPAITVDPFEVPVTQVDEEEVTIIEMTIYGQLASVANDEVSFSLT